jgi:hypothetical protein
LIFGIAIEFKFSSSWAASVFVRVCPPTLRPVSVSLRQHFTLFLHLHIGETVVGRQTMKFKKQEILGVLLGAGLNLLNSLRERLPDNLDDMKTRVRDIPMAQHPTG